MKDSKEGPDVERLIVFVKLPTPGLVKTRLAKAMGAETAAALYRCFVTDTLATARRNGYPALIFFDPPGAHDAVRKWLGDEMICLPQEGEDLGKRMAAAFREAFRDCSRAVLVGTDCPDLPHTILWEAFRALENHDAVIGPAADGGYYLIGFSKAGFSGAVFEGIRWGTEGVFEATAALLRENQVSFQVLPPWGDMDEYGDVEVFFARQKDAHPGRLATVDFLRENLNW